MTTQENPAADLIERIRRNWPEAVSHQMMISITAQRLARRLSEIARSQLAAFGLSLTEFEALCALRTQASPHRLTPSDLYDQMLISSGGLTKVLKGLEARAYIRRPVSKGDRRSRPVELTARGRVLVEKAMREVQIADGTALSIDPDDPSETPPLVILLLDALARVESAGT